MFYTIYKITNQINGKIYIGKHQTKDLNDRYMGSGKILLAAQKKDGIKNFSREWLHIFDNEEDMNAKEKELVTEEFCLREDTYNLCVGGHGGFSYINRNGLSIPVRDQKVDWLTVSQKGMGSMQAKRKEWESKRVAKIKERYGDDAFHHFKGKKHTLETKHKMSIAARNRTTNSQTGSAWIVKDGIPKKIKMKDIDLYIEQGYTRGRK